MQTMHKKLLLASLIATLGTTAHASAELHVSTSVTPLHSAASVDSDAAYGTGSASAESGNSAAWGSIDTTTGTITLATRAQTADSTVYTGAWASASINDTITIDYSAPYALVAVSVNFAFDYSADYAFPASSAITGSTKARHLSPAALSRINGGFTMYGMDLNAPPSNYEVAHGEFSFSHHYQLDFDSGPYVALNHPSTHKLEEWSEEQHSLEYALPDGRASGFTISQILEIPTNTAIDISFWINMSSVCSLTASCDLLADGSHTFSLGFTPLQGTLSSANGYSYLAAPVPEPGTYAMLLAGLGVIGAVARRRREQTQG